MGTPACPPVGAVAVVCGIAPTEGNTPHVVQFDPPPLTPQLLQPEGTETPQVLQPEEVTPQLLQLPPLLQRPKIRASEIVVRKNCEMNNPNSKSRAFRNDI